jgi:hypothetical protein
MADSSKVEVPDSYHLIILAINDTPVKQLPRPLTPSDEDRILVRIEPIHVDPTLAQPKELIVTMPELREMQYAARNNQVFLVAELSGEPGISAGEVKLGRQLLDKIQREQEKRRAKS